MKRPSMLKFCVLLVLFVVIGFIYLATQRIICNDVVSLFQLPRSTFKSDYKSSFNTGVISAHHHQQKIFISLVVCETRFNESMNVVKSVLLFTKSRVHFVIFTDDKLWSKFNKSLTHFQALSKNQLGFELHKINFPEENKEDWLNLFSKCAAQRLFIPKIIDDIDALIYVDTDTLFLGPAEDLWQYFEKFNSSHISAMALEDDNPNISWYPRFAKHPYYGKYGLNSGVMLMNLTRMRDFGWVDYVTPVMIKWKLYIPWGDQDIINIIFAYHGRRVLELPCSCNFRSDQCVYGDACAAAARGVRLLHGSRAAFHSRKQPVFQAIYRAIDEHEYGVDPPTKLLDSMRRYLREAPAGGCGAARERLLLLPARLLPAAAETATDRRR